MQYACNDADIITECVTYAVTECNMELLSTSTSPISACQSQIDTSVTNTI